MTEVLVHPDEEDVLEIIPDDRVIEDQTQSLQEGVIFSDNSFKYYLRQIGRFPILNKQQNKVMFRGLKNDLSVEDVTTNPDFISEIKPEDQERFDILFGESKDIREAIFNSNARFVVFVAARLYRAMGKSFQDFPDGVADGNFGLMNAIEKFEPEKDLTFSSYAYPAISRAIKRGMGKMLPGMRYPDHFVHDKAVITRVSEALSTSLGRPATYAEMEAAFLETGNNRTEGRFEKAFQEVEGNGFIFQSLDRPFADDDDTLAAHTQDEFADTENDATQAVYSEQVAQVMGEEVAKLPDKRAREIVMRHAAGESYHQMLKDYNVTTKQALSLVRVAAFKILRENKRLRQLLET